MIEVRILGPGDADVLDGVATGVFDKPINLQLTTEFLSDSRHHIAVAIDGGIVVGMASAVNYIHPDKPVELWITEVGVAEQYRRKGVGRLLLQALFDLGRELGCREAWVLTEPDNEAAKGLYAGARGRSESAVMYSFRLLEDEPAG